MENAVGVSRKKRFYLIEVDQIKQDEVSGHRWEPGQ
jgi:hypothetical protein